MAENKYVEMICHLKETRLKDIPLPEAYEIRSLKDIHPDDIYPCYLAAFQAGDHPFFQQQYDAEKRDFFDSLGFDQAKNMPESSLILKYNQIAGFTLIVPYGETNCHISCMCVHPDDQQQGLGAFMLKQAINTATLQGYKTITLWTETAMGAFQLYLKHGFEIRVNAGVSQ
jgi:ribosomal protein S18 acetylase RimI-like enzyme